MNETARRFSFTARKKQKPKCAWQRCKVIPVMCVTYENRSYFDVRPRFGFFVVFGSSNSGCSLHLHLKREKLGEILPLFDNKSIEIMEINQTEDSETVLEQNAGDIQPKIEEQPVKLEFKVDMDEAMKQLDVPYKKVKKMENAYLLALNTKEQIEVSKITIFLVLF